MCDINLLIGNGGFVEKRVWRINRAHGKYCHVHDCIFKDSCEMEDKAL